MNERTLINIKVIILFMFFVSIFQSCLSKKELSQFNCQDSLYIKLNDNHQDLINFNNDISSTGGSKYGEFLVYTFVKDMEFDFEKAIYESTFYDVDVDGFVTKVAYAFIDPIATNKPQDFFSYTEKRYIEHFHCIPEFKEKISIQKIGSSYLKFNDFGIEFRNIDSLYRMVIFTSNNK